MAEHGSERCRAEEHREEQGGELEACEPEEDDARRSCGRAPDASPDRGDAAGARAWERRPHGDHEHRPTGAAGRGRCGDVCLRLSAGLRAAGDPRVRGGPQQPPGQRAVERVRVRARAARAGDDVRLAQQRHPLHRSPRSICGRPARAARPRHRRPLLRAAVRRRVDEQLRLHRAPRDRHRRAGVPARAARLRRRRRPTACDVVAAPRPASPTIVGRVQVDGEADLPAVHALQDQFTLTPVRRGAPAAPALPEPDPRRAPTTCAWWERFRRALAAFPPPPATRRSWRSPRRSASSAASRRTSIPTGARRGAGRGCAGRRASDRAARQGRPRAGERVELSATHCFDYNLDSLRPRRRSTRPSGRSTTARRAYATRAAAARAGLWGNHGYEADYEIVYVDADGEQLDGARPLRAATSTTRRRSTRSGR